MAKTKGYIVSAKFFVPIDKKDFGKQVAVLTMMKDIGETRALTPDFLAQATVMDVAIRDGSYEAGLPPVSDGAGETAGASTDEQIDTLGGAIDGAPAKRQRKPAEAAAE